MQRAAGWEPHSNCTAMQGHGHPHPLSTPHLSAPWQLWEDFIDWKRNTCKACVGAGFSESHQARYLGRSPPGYWAGVRAGAFKGGLAFPTCSGGAKAQILQSPGSIEQTFLTQLGEGNVRRQAAAVNISSCCHGMTLPYQREG